MDPHSDEKMGSPQGASHPSASRVENPDWTLPETISSATDGTKINQADGKQIAWRRLGTAQSLKYSTTNIMEAVRKHAGLPVVSGVYP